MLRRACRCERVDTGWLAILVTLACSEIRLHLSALRLLVSLLLAVSAFTFKLAGRFIIFLFALASLLGLALAPPLPPLPLSDRDPLPLPCRS